MDHENQFKPSWKLAPWHKHNVTSSYIFEILLSWNESTLCCLKFCLVVGRGMFIVDDNPSHSRAGVIQPTPVIWLRAGTFAGWMFFIKALLRLIMIRGTIPRREISNHHSMITIERLYGWWQSHSHPTLLGTTNFSLHTLIALDKDYFPYFSFTKSIQFIPGDLPQNLYFEQLAPSICTGTVSSESYL